MQVLQAGDHKFLLLELDPDFVANIAKQAGFEYKIEDGKRWLCLDLLAADRQAPLLLFDAADPGNLGWFSRCQFYVGNPALCCRRPFPSRIKKTAPAAHCRILSGCKLRRNYPRRSAFRASSR